MQALARSLVVSVLVAAPAVSATAQPTTFAVLHSFDGANGGSPVSSLVQADDGSLYGTTAFGGRYGDGVVFRIVPPAP